MDNTHYDLIRPKLRRKISDNINSCSLDKCGKHDDTRQEDDYNKALENFKYYKTIKNTVNHRYERIQKLRYLIIPILLFLIVIRTFSSANPNIQNSVSFEKVKSFWRGIFLGSKEVITIDTLDMLMSQVYNSFYKAYHVNDFLFVGVSYDPIDLLLVYSNLDTSEMKQIRLQKRFEFDRTNITRVLNLPFDLNNEPMFKKFSSTYDTITIVIRNVFYCLDLLGTKDCLQSNIRLDYVNRGFKYLGFISVALINYIDNADKMLLSYREFSSDERPHRSKRSSSRFGKLKGVYSTQVVNSPESQLASSDVLQSSLPAMNEYPCRDDNCSLAYFDDMWDVSSLSLAETYEMVYGPSVQIDSGVSQNDDNVFPMHLYDFFKQNKLIIIIILFTSVTGLILDLAVYHVVILDHKLEKSFELKLILLNQETTFHDNLFSLPKKKLTFWTLLSTLKNIVTIFFCITMIFPGMHTSIKTYLSYWIQMLVWMSVVEVLNNQKNFGLIMLVFKNAFQHYTKSFIGYITLASAFIVSATLIFQTSEKYLTLSDSFYTIFSLMVGDSVLDFFNDLKSYGMFGTLFMICCILFFVFMIQSLYITIITDSFFTFMDEDDFKPLEESPVLKMAESQVKEAPLTNRSEIVNHIPEESKEYESILKNESGIRNESMFGKDYTSKNESIIKKLNHQESPLQNPIEVSEEDQFSYVINTEECSPSPHNIPLRHLSIPPLKLEKQVNSYHPPGKDPNDNFSTFDINLADFKRPSNLLNKVKTDDQTMIKEENGGVDIEENTDIELFNLQQKRLLEIDKTRLKNELEMVNKMKRLIQSNFVAKKSDDKLMFQFCLDFIISKIKRQTKNIQKMKNHI
jgi:hypothetical protein